MAYATPKGACINYHSIIHLISLNFGSPLGFAQNITARTTYKGKDKDFTTAEETVWFFAMYVLPFKM